MKIEKPDSTPEELKELISQARSHLETNDAQAAVDILKTGFPAYSKNEKFCFEFGYALYELGDFPEASKHLKASIKLAPNVRPQKYFTLAQVSDDKHAKELYLTGVSLSEAKLAELAGSGLEPTDALAKQRELKRPMAQALCALAQLEEKKLETGKAHLFSEADFLRGLSTAAATHPGYLETYFLGAMYYFNCQNEALFRQAVTALVSQVAALEEAEDEELDEWSCQFYLPLIRLLIECQMWVEAERLAEVGLGSDSANLEATYLLCFSLFSQDKLGEADEVLDRLKTLRIEECGDQELIDGYHELSKEVAEKRKLEPKGEQGQADEEDWASDDQEGE